MEICELKAKNMLPILTNIIKQNLEDNTTEFSRVPAPSANSSQLSYNFNEIKNSTEDTYILVKTSWPLISNDETVTVTYCIFLVKYNDKFYIVPYNENFNYPIEEYTEEKEDN